MHFLTSGIRCKKQSRNIDWPTSLGPYRRDVFLRGLQQSWGMCSDTCMGLLILLKRESTVEAESQRQVCVVQCLERKEPLRDVKTSRTFQSELTFQSVVPSPPLTSFHDFETVMPAAWHVVTDLTLLCVLPKKSWAIDPVVICCQNDYVCYSKWVVLIIWLDECYCKRLKTLKVDLLHFSWLTLSS